MRGRGSKRQEPVGTGGSGGPPPGAVHEGNDSRCRRGGDREQWSCRRGVLGRVHAEGDLFQGAINLFFGVGV